MTQRNTEWTAVFNPVLLLGNLLIAALISLLPTALVVGFVFHMVQFPDDLSANVGFGICGLVTALVTYMLYRPWKTIDLGDEDFTLSRRDKTWTIRYEWLTQIGVATGIQRRFARPSFDVQEVVLVFEPKPGVACSTAIHLRISDVDECIAAIKQRSQNATAIDTNGVVNLPSSPERRSSEARKYSAKYLLYAIASILGGVAGAFASVRSLYFIIFNSGGWDAALDCIGALFLSAPLVGFGFWSLSQYRHHRNQATNSTSGHSKPPLSTPVTTRNIDGSLL